jgi:L-cysteine/cystine lyase
VTSVAPRPVATSAEDAAKVEALRLQLPATSETAYFNAGTNGPIPRLAFEALHEAAKLEVDAGRIRPGVYQAAFERNQRVRDLIAQIFGADGNEIALTHSSTEGLNAALMGIRWQPGDEVITTTLEHPGVFNPLGLVAFRYGVVVRTIDIGNGGGDVVSVLAKAVTPRTRAIVASHVQWSSGAIMPLAELADLAHRHHALLIVDAAQGAGQAPINLHASGVDVYALSGQKWLCGPEATGALYVRKSRIPDIAPTYVRYAQSCADGFIVPPSAAFRYEIGEFYGPSILALEKTLLWMRDDIGFDWLYNRVAALGRYAWDRLDEQDGVTVTTPRDIMAGLVCFTVEGMTVQDVAAKLYEHGITIRYVAYPPGPTVARVACGWWNTEEEVDNLAEAVGKLARDAALVATD